MKADPIDDYPVSKEEKEVPKPFPYWPPVPTQEFKVRNELMHQLNMWENNDPVIAQRHAGSLILLLAEQFKLPLMVGEQEDGMTVSKKAMERINEMVINPPTVR